MTAVASYAHGAAPIALTGATIGAAFDEIAARYPANDCVVSTYQGNRLTCAQMRVQTDRLAAGLAALGVQHGDRVGIWSPNNIEWVVAQFATPKIGAVLVNIRVQAEMHLLEITICYGMTETSPVSTQTAVDDRLDKRTGTVGRVHPHIEIKIVDTDGRIVPRGTPAELCSRGYSVMLGYGNDPQQTAEVIDAARYMHTGEIAIMDAEGYVEISGRIKDMVIRGGENIYPREVEEFLYTLPAVKDVAVIGIPDERYGEELCAWIILHADASLDAESIRSFCREKIAHYKIPYCVVFVESFPLTVTGKVQKYKMREQSAKLLRSTLTRPDGYLVCLAEALGDLGSARLRLNSALSSLPESIVIRLEIGSTCAETRPRPVKRRNQTECIRLGQRLVLGQDFITLLDAAAPRPNVAGHSSGQSPLKARYTIILRIKVEFR